MPNNLLEKRMPNVIANLETPVVVHVRFGRINRDVTLTAVHYEDRGKQRYIFFDGVFLEGEGEDEQEHICNNIPITDAFAKFHNKIVALAFMQEEAEQREKDRIEELYGAVAQVRIYTGEETKAELQVRMQPTAGVFMYQIDDGNVVQVMHRGKIPLTIYKGAHIHIAVLDMDTGLEHGIADMVISNLEQPPLLGVSVQEPLELYVFVNGDIYGNKRKPATLRKAIPG